MVQVNHKSTTLDNFWSPKKGCIIARDRIKRDFSQNSEWRTTYTFITYELPFTLSYNNDYEWDVFLPGAEPESLVEVFPHASFRIVDSLKALNVNKMIQCCADNRDENRIGWAEYHLLIGSYLKDQKLFAEAALEYEKLGELLSNSYPFEELVTLYDHCGDLARYKRSKALEQVNKLLTPNNSGE